MKKSVFVSILLFALFYTTLLSTMVVIPLVLAARYDAAMVIVDRDAQVWERLIDAPAKMKSHHELRPPQSDVPVSGSAVRRAPIDKSAPDAALIKSERVQAKTIQVQSGVAARWQAETARKPQ